MKKSCPTKKLKEWKKKLILLFRRYKGFFRISFEKKIPRLYVHEKFEKHVKWILRILLLISICSSVISFHVWYLNLFLAIVLIIIEQFFERVVFIFTTIFIPPIPESYQPEDWKGVVWGIPLDKDDKRPFIVAPLFKNRESAVRIFRCLESWNYNQNEDFNDNISISAIIENKDEYSIYMYPGIGRVSLKQWKEEVKREKPNCEHQSLVIPFIFCKKFKYGGSYFETFKNKYVNGREFLFIPYRVEANGAVPLEEFGYIVKNKIKIKCRSELTQKDLEFDHGRFVMNL